MKHLFIKPTNTIKDGLKQLNKSGEKCLLVTNSEEKFLGTLSDGDVRKAILNGTEINDFIKKIYNKKPTILYEGNYNNKKIKEIFIKKQFDLIPVVNKKQKIIDVIYWAKFFDNDKKNKNEPFDVPVVIMAGGKGTRLEPFTKILPKPLIPIHNKPIIEHIIERFNDIGCSDFHLTINYKGKILKAYFDELNPDYNISFVDEHEPLGTAGSLRFLSGKFQKPFFVTNCDTIIKADIKSLYDFHNKGNYDVSLVASAKEYIIPYGTCELKNTGLLSHINEKPKYDFLVNTGLYVINPDILNLIPKNKFYHITHLIEKAKNKGFQIGVFPISDDSWIDIGQWAEYKKAIDKI